MDLQELDNNFSLCSRFDIRISSFEMALLTSPGFELLDDDAALSLDDILLRR